MVRKGRGQRPIELLLALRGTGAGLAATVGRGLNTLVREGKKTAFFVGHRTFE